MEKKPLIATELLRGQGLGNQLFCYVTTRCIAMRNQCDYSILGSETPVRSVFYGAGIWRPGGKGGLCEGLS